MYNITNLSKESHSFISELSLSNKTRTLPVSIAIARILSNELILPSSPVENIQLFYNTQVKVDLICGLSELNEIFIVNTKDIEDLVFNFYLLRYNSVYPCSHIIALSKETAIVDFFKISKVLDKATLACIEENCIYITGTVTKLLRLIEDLKGNSK